MPTSFAANALPFWFDKQVSSEGTCVLISSGTITANDYGEKNQENFSVTGSYFANAIFTPMKEREKQFLPEGNRRDSIYNLYVETGSFFEIDNRVQISGTTNQYEIMQVFDLPIMGNSTLWKKARIVQL